MCLYGYRVELSTIHSQMKPYIAKSWSVLHGAVGGRRSNFELDMSLSFPNRLLYRHTSLKAKYCPLPPIYLIYAWSFSAGTTTFPSELRGNSDHINIQHVRQGAHWSAGKACPP